MIYFASVLNGFFIGLAYFPIQEFNFLCLGLFHSLFIVLIVGFCSFKQVHAHRVLSLARKRFIQRFSFVSFSSIST